MQILVAFIGLVLVIALLAFIVVVGHHVGVSTPPAIGPDEPDAHEGGMAGSAHAH